MFCISLTRFFPVEQHTMRWRRVWFADMVVDRHHKCDANICLVALTCPGVLFLTALITAIKKL